MIADSQKHKIVTIDYTNWKGERRLRRILPHNIVWCHTPYHPKEQWMITAWDVEDDDKYKYFPLKNIHTWEAG